MRISVLIVATLLAASPRVDAGLTTRVSVPPDHTQANGASYEPLSSTYLLVPGRPAMSADGNLVAFASDASNLVAGDVNGKTDIFVHDRTTDANTLVSVASDGSQGDGQSFSPALSGDGCVLAFASQATNLVPGDTNGEDDIFVHDCATGATTRVSVASDGSQANHRSFDPTISADGRFVAFHSCATNLGETGSCFDVFVHDRVTGATTYVSNGVGGQPPNDYVFGVIAGGGRFVLFNSGASNLVPGDTNGTFDVFVHDRDTATTTRVSVASDGTEANGTSDGLAISDDGRFVAFQSGATNLVPGGSGQNIYVRDRNTGTTTRISVAPGGSGPDATVDEPSISADGRFVLYRSYATNLAAGGAGTLLYDQTTGTTTKEFRIFNYPQTVALSGNARFLVFATFAGWYVPGDTNQLSDVFVHDRVDTCGNGTLDPGERCDDGNLVDGDGCESDCTVTLCSSGLAIADAKVRLTRLDVRGSTDSLARVYFAGHVDVPPGALPGFDPVTRGLQVSIETTGVDASAMFDLTFRNAPIPPGGPGTGCDPVRDGWTTNAARTTYRYKNKSNTLDPMRCDQPADGLFVAVFRDERATRGRIGFLVRAANATLYRGFLTSPLRATLVFGTAAADGLAGTCAANTFTASQCFLGSGGHGFTCQ